MFPLQLVLREILVLQEMSSQSTNLTGTMAEAMHSKQQLAAVIKYGVMIVSTLPIIIVYPFLQRYFVKGVMIGSLKG
jgi:putative aldouronate transport system permease protein